MILKNTIFETKKHYFVAKTIVSFDSGVGTLPEDQIEYVVGKPFSSLPTPSYDSNQWKFEGWYDADGNQVNEQTIVEGPMVLTAQYQRMYSIEFYWHFTDAAEYDYTGEIKIAAEGEPYYVTMNDVIGGYENSIDNAKWQWVDHEWNDENGSYISPWQTVDESSPKTLYANQTKRGGGEGIEYPTQSGHYKICLNGEWEMEEHDNGNGYRIWKSFSNTGASGETTWAKMYITFNDFAASGFGVFDFYVNSYSEQGYDYATVYEMDYDPEGPEDGNNILFTMYDNQCDLNPHDYSSDISQNDAYHLVNVYPEYGQHFICITYRKDVSVDNYDDCGRLAVNVSNFDMIEE